MAEAPDRFFLDLAYPFAGELELLADLLKRERMLPAEADVDANHLRFPLGQRAERPLDFLAEGFLDQGMIGERRSLVLDDVEKPVVLPLCERSVHRQVAPRNLQCIGHFEERHIELFGQFARTRLPFELLLERAERLADLVQRSDAVERKTDDARLLRKRLQN